MPEGYSQIVVGSEAHDSPDADSPVKIGAVATNDITAVTAVATGDRVQISATNRGVLFVAGGIGLQDGVLNIISYLGQAETEGPLGAGLYGLAPDTSLDRLRTLGDTGGAGLGILGAAPWVPGASDIKTTRFQTATDSSVRATVATPTSGKKIRMVGLGLRNASVTGVFIEVYFGAGTNISSDITKAIAEPLLDTDTLPSLYIAFPDGGGPVGAVDDVLSIRTNADITTNVSIVPIYREE